MTNIMGFKIENDGPVYLCSDSQATAINDRGPFDKRPRQKLFYQGGVLFVGSGDRERILRLREAVADEKRGSVIQIMEKMMKRAESIDVDMENPNESATLFLAGIEDGHPVLYDMSPWGEKNLKPYYKKVEFAVLGGSGTSKTGPALERDLELGGISLNDIIEGMTLCFSYGERAGRDMYVDDKLQIGIVGNNFVRTLYHPMIELGKSDYHGYLVANFNSEPGRVEEAEKITHGKVLHDARACLNDLYQAIYENCVQMNNLSAAISRCGVMSVADRKNRQKYEKSRGDAIAERDKHKGYVSELVDAWISGDILRIDAAIRSSAYRHFESYERTGMHFGKSSEQLSFAFMKPEFVKAVPPISS
ncbi:MAG: hypothetical protein HYW27_01260 [Candidatus Aenigmarchaeota archaeon]|nr:hypothetical protein [Candidatus Aenigmarchaeota archaeon]